MATVNKYSNPRSLETYMDADNAQALPWVPLNTVRDLLVTLRTVNFSTQEGRNIGLDAIASIVYSTPFTISPTLPTSDVRFGDLFAQSAAASTSSQQLVPHVALYCDGWQAVFDALQNSLNFKDRTNSTAPDTPSTPLDIMTVYGNYNDASQAFRWALNNAVKLLRCGSGVYNGLTFERKFGLIYGTAVQPFPPIAED